MNDIFNFERFGRLFIKHTIEHYKSYIMSLTVLAGVLILGGSFLIYLIQIPIDKGFQTALFIFLLLLSGSFFTSTSFNDIGDSKKAISALSLPASHLEKYLVAWLYSFALFLIVFAAVFLSAVFIATTLQHIPGHPTELINVFDSHLLEIYVVYAFLHSVTFFGAIFFKKLHFIKTSFVFFISLALAITFNKIAISLLLNRDIGVPMPYGNVKFTEGSRMAEINFNGMPDPYIAWLAAVLAVILWVAAYYKLKEKQV